MSSNAKFLVSVYLYPCCLFFYKRKDTRVHIKQEIKQEKIDEASETYESLMARASVDPRVREYLDYQQQLWTKLSGM